MNVAILLANGFEDCEGLMVVDLCRRAKVCIDLYSITNQNTVTTSHRVSIRTECTIDTLNVDNYDMLVIPGGKAGVDNLNSSDEVKRVIAQFMYQDKYVAAVCAGPSVLGRLGYLQDKKYTCYPGFEQYVIGGTYTGSRVEVDGKLITAKGLGCEFEFCRAILQHLVSEQEVQQVFDSIQY